MTTPLNRLVNGDFATGDLTGWTGTGTVKTSSSPMYGRGEPTYFLEGSVSNPAHDVYQDVTVHPTEIGTTARLIAYRGQTAADDTGEVKLEALDATDAILASDVVGPDVVSPEDRWQRYDLSLVIPAGTVKLRVRAKSYSITGSFSNAAVDSLELRVGNFTGNLLTNPGFETGDTTGWTITGTSGLQDFDLLASYGARPGAAEGNYALMFTGDGEASQTITLTPSQKNGRSIVHLSAFRCNTHGDDLGQLFLEVLDGTGTVIASQETPNEAIDPLDRWMRRYLTVSIPSGADSIRVRYTCTLVAGADTNSLVDDLDLFVEEPVGSPTGWYDVSDLSTLWQDTAGTVPVTTDGQKVARIDDKSGNGRNFVQSNVSYQPVYRTDGLIHWLEFASSGVNLRSQATIGDVLSGTEHYYGVSFNADLIDTNHTSSYRNDAPFASSNADVGTFLRSTGKAGAFVYAGGDKNIEFDYAAGNPAVILSKHDGSDLYVTNVDNFATSIPAGTFSGMGTYFEIGRGWSNNAYSFNGKFYGLLIYDTIQSDRQVKNDYAYLYGLQGEAPEFSTVSVTQAPIEVIEAGGSGKIRLTQLPIFAIATEAQPVRVTQLAMIVPIVPRPIPEPWFPIWPETPVRELWEYNSTVNAMAAGNEQRFARLDEPRYAMELSFVVTSEEERRKVYELLYRNIGRALLYPIYPRATKLTADVSAGATKVFFNPADTDMRNGEFISFHNPYTEVSEYARIATVDADGATLDAPLTFDLTAQWYAAPALEWRIGSGAGVEMSQRTGRGRLKLTSLADRPVKRPGNAVSLTMLDGLPVLTKRPLIPADEVPTQRVDWLDNGQNRQEPIKWWDRPFFGGTRAFSFHGQPDLDYWASFAKATRGQQKPFLLPTYWNDIELAAPITPGATTFKTDTLIYEKYFAGENYRYLRFETANGVKYRKVAGINIDYDPVYGEPVSITIRLNSSLGATANDVNVSKISLMNKVRLDADTIELEHYGLDGIISFKFRAVDQ